MITTTWTAPSSVVLGRGAAGLGAADPMAAVPGAPARGTGLPVAGWGTTGSPATSTGSTVPGTAPVDVVRPPARQDGAERFLLFPTLPQRDGTTLGIPFPGRPQS